jgi:hypothetical protein
MRLDALQCLEALALKTSGRQSNTVRTLGQASSISTRSWILAVDIVWEVFARRPDDVATCPDDVQYFRVPFEREKDFREDCPDTRSSRPDVNLIKIELRCF